MLNVGVALVAVENQRAVSYALSIIRLLRDYGFDSVWLSDVVVCPPKYEDLAYEMELISFTSYLASRIDNIVLGTSVALLPQRNPVILAKQAATIDILTKGRFILGVGAGWRNEEMRFLGIDPRERGERMEEYIKLMRRLWTEKRTTFHGRFVKLRDASIGISPIQKRGPPIWMGGNTLAAMKRAALLGDAWHPQNLTPGGLRPLARRFLNNDKNHRLTLRVGVDFNDVKRGRWAQVNGSAESVANYMNQYSEMGVSHIVLVLGWDMKTITKNVKTFGEKVLHRIR